MAPLKALHSTEAGRLLIAFMGSVLLHMAPFFWGWLPYWNSKEPGRQITLHVSLQLPQKTVQTKPKITPSSGKNSRDKIRQKKRKQSLPDPRKMLGGSGPAIPQPEAEQESKPEHGEMPEQDNNAEAVPLDKASVPAYPVEAKQKGLESCVLAAIYVSALGEVSAVRILHADVTGVFDQSVIEAQGAVRYLPARQNGENMPSRVLAVIGFTLEPGRHLNCARKYAEVARRINALPISAEVDMNAAGGLIGKP